MLSQYAKHGSLFHCTYCRGKYICIRDARLYNLVCLMFVAKNLLYSLNILGLKIPELLNNLAVSLAFRFRGLRFSNIYRCHQWRKQRKGSLKAVVIIEEHIYNAIDY